MNGNNITQTLALLIIDMQESIMKVIDSSESLLNRCCFAVEAAQLLNIPVIFTEQAPDKLGPQHFKLNQLASKGSVYSKSYFSSIKASGLLDFLKNQNIDHLLIGGIETPICVYQTVIDALEKDFLVSPLVVIVVVAATMKADHPRSLLVPDLVASHTRHDFVFKDNFMICQARPVVCWCSYTWQVTRI